MRAERFVQLFAIALSACLALACEPESTEHALECPSLDHVVRLDDVHFDAPDCGTAVASAEGNRTIASYRSACEQLAPEEGMPARVVDVWASGCTPSDDEGSGVTLQIVICCP